MRLILKISFLILFFSLIYSIFPNPSNKGDCWWPFKFNLNIINLNYNISCDSPEFARLVVRFPYGFAENKLRINRPLYPFLAQPIYYALKPFDILTQTWKDLANNKMTEIRLVYAWEKVSLEDFTRAWLALIIVNLSLAGFSIYLIFHGLRNFKIKHPLFFSSLILLSPSFRDFGLIPHTEMFNLLFPSLIFFIYSNYHRFKFNLPLLSLLFGFLLLGKGYLFIIPLIIYISYAKNKRISIVLFNLFLITLPSILYLLLLNIFKTPYYNLEVDQYRQGIWFMDLFNSSGFNVVLFEIVSKFFQLTKGIIRVFQIDLIIIIALGVIKRFQIIQIFSKSDFKFTCIYFLSWVCFFILIGYFEDRHIYSIFPIIIYILSKLITFYISNNKILIIKS